jgi:hypothetical protein
VTDQWLELFDRWFERHLAGIRLKRAEAHARITAFIAQSAGTLRPEIPLSARAVK